MEHNEIEPGDKITGFKLITPLDEAGCRKHIDSSLFRGLPEALGRRSLTVIANGPSARNVDLHTLAHPTLALNGAIDLFAAQGLAPTFWACCDPQDKVADLLPNNPPADTTYLVASKCHPDVFRKLHGRNVKLWHILDYPVEGRAHVALCSSITLCSAWLMYRMGFTDFEFFGWDGCFMDGLNHAGHNNAALECVLHINYGGSVVDGKVIGGRTFATSRSWAAEAHGAEQFFQLAKYFDIGVKLHGDGMFKCVQESLEAA